MTSSAATRSRQARRIQITLRLAVDWVIGLLLVVGSVIALTAYEIIHLTGYSYPQGNDPIYSLSSFDEGVYAETGILIAHGYSLFTEIYSAQPPMLPEFLAVVDQPFGANLVDARWAMLGFGILTVIGVAAIAGLARGWIAAGVAAALLVLSPEFLVYSHAIEEEIPMSALAVVSLAFALTWYRRDEVELAAAAGFLFSLAMLTKFLAVSLILPFALIAGFALWERRHNIRGAVFAIAVFVAAAVIPFVISFAIWGRAAWDQMVSDRFGATADASQFQTVSSLHLLRDFLATDPGLAVAAVLGSVALLSVDWKLGVIVDSWLGATLAELMRYHPLFGHHLTVLLAPMAVVAGAGIACALPARMSDFNQSARRDMAPSSHVVSELSTENRLATSGLAVLTVIVYLAFFPIHLSSYPRLLGSPTAADIQLKNVARIIDQNVPPKGMVVSADPMICVLAHRLCVPETVDTSYVRIETGSLTSQLAERYTGAERADAVVLGRALCLTGSTNRKPYMRGYDRWVFHRYRLVAPVAVDSPPTCPWRADNKPVRYSRPSGVYVAGALGPKP